MDEPDTHVDNKFEMELYALLKELNQKMTILLVSHDIGIISPYIKTIACVNRNLHYHSSNEISEEQLKVYNCPIEIISHGPIPHRVMREHNM
jgi:zinc transport system ATP-binding protein